MMTTVARSKESDERNLKHVDHMSLSAPSASLHIFQNTAHIQGILLIKSTYKSLTCVSKNAAPLTHLAPHLLCAAATHRFYPPPVLQRKGWPTERELAWLFCLLAQIHADVSAIESGNIVLGFRDKVDSCANP